MALPYFQTKDQQVNMLQTAWKANLDALLACPLVQGRQISNVVLKAGTNVINHGLGHKLQGWIIVGVDGATTIYDQQASNQQSQLTLVLNSSAPVTCSLWVY